MKKFENQKKIKSIGFILIMMLLLVTVLVIFMSLIRSESVPPNWVITLLIIALFGSFIYALIIRSRDIMTPERQHNLIDYFKPIFVIYLFYILLTASLEILVHTCRLRPVDYNMLPNIILHTIVYIIVFTLLWLVCVQIILKRYLEVESNDKATWKSNVNSKTGIYVSLIFLFILMLFGLRLILLNVYDYYNTGYSRYGDIASFMCVFGGFIGFALILCIQNRSSFIPFRFLNCVVEMIIAFDSNERLKKKTET